MVVAVTFAYVACVVQGLLAVVFLLHAADGAMLPGIFKVPEGHLGWKSVIYLGVSSCMLLKLWCLDRLTAGPFRKGAGLFLARECRK